MDDKAAHLRGVVKGFKIADKSFLILDDLNFEILKGESLAVVGTSGIGKSTLLHILGTLDFPDQGKIDIDGKTIYEFSDLNGEKKLDEKELSDFRNRNIGFVFQFHHLLPEFTALENTMMPLLIKDSNILKETFSSRFKNFFNSPFRKTIKKETVSAAEEILERVGLKDRMLHMPGELSGGEQQRVAIARAIIQKPALLLADEPTGNLDIRTSAKIHELLLELNRDLKMTVVTVTHNQELASLMNRQVTLFEGKIKEL